MSTLSNDVISAAQDGKEWAQEAVYASVRPMLRSIAGEFAGTNVQEREELEAEAALHLFAHLAGYKVGSRAKLTTYLLPRIRQDVRSAHFGSRYSGAIDGEAASRYARAAGEVHQEARQERNEGGGVVPDGEIHDRIKGRLMNLDHGLAWREEKFLAVHDLAFAGPQSLNVETGEDGEELGVFLAEEMGLGTVTEERNREAGRRKKAMVRELLDGGHLSDDQRTILMWSFGMGMDGEYVSGLLETSGRRMKGQHLSSDARTDLELAELLGKDVSSPKAEKTACASVRQSRKRALAKLAKVAADWEYPGRDLTAPTQKGAALLDAVRRNDEGVYVRELPGKGRPLVRVRYLNDEGDMVEILASRSRLVTLGVLEGERVERQEIEANHGYHKVYGYGACPVGIPVFDNGATDMTGVPMGVGVLELVERQGEKALPVAGRDYSAPLWDVRPEAALEHLRSRAYLAKH